MKAFKAVFTNFYEYRLIKKKKKAIPCKLMARVNDRRQIMIYWFDTKKAMEI